MNDSTIESQGNSEDTSALHSEDVASLASQVLDNHRQLKQRLQQLQECVDQLRLMAKYQAFDLEATRRENADLKTLLELDY